MERLYCNGKKDFCDRPIECCGDRCHFYDGTGSEVVEQPPVEKKKPATYGWVELRAAAARLMYSDNRDIRDYNKLIDFINSHFQPEKAKPTTGPCIDKEESGLLTDD